MNGQTIESTISVGVGSLITAMLVHFMLNQVPHTLGLFDRDVEAVSRSRWARNIARGQLRLMGVGPDDPNYERYLESYAKAVAEGFVT